MNAKLDDLKPWDEMTPTEQRAERALPKADRKHLALLRSLQAPRGPARGRIQRSRRGTWGRIITTGCRRGYVAAMTARECAEAKLEPGPGNV